MSIKRIQTAGPAQLGYRQPSTFVRFAVAAFVAIALLVGTTTRMILDWPEDAWAYGGGIMFSLLLLVWAARQTASYDVVFDAEVNQLTATVRWPWRTTVHIHDLSDIVEVARHSARPIESRDLHWVVLRKTDGGELELFEEPRLDYLASGEADSVAEELGKFLKLPVVYYADSVRRRPDNDLGRKKRGHTSI